MVFLISTFAQRSYPRDANVGIRPLACCPSGSILFWHHPCKTGIPFAPDLWSRAGRLFFVLVATVIIVLCHELAMLLSASHEGMLIKL
ncbi:hypothetical protein Oant_2517 [Brucella anthropi ATCC 49188]|uniref:Uncharacterized protein n=1 Tax=Brucella anthropi (strain ATCC 49188 / DSM 6882 / CCUG 24695 / JCM 21032 / LMG 3331 / NBRC 15819 / NCTC 12168 / Alc 37) TaxID=439375 RepID=A6X1X6_BRUA4|nr:hypothetical protein Oant_2517 [Brucella anthropi ATCC 49188]